jgi:N-methylhydantoinase A
MTAESTGTTAQRHGGPAGYVIGVDIGGTFTDCVVYAPDGTMTAAKAPTTPENRAQGFFESSAPPGRC